MTTIIIYLLSDGGIWRCKYGTNDCTSRNNNLSVTQFYDFDSSKSNQKNDDRWHTGYGYDSLYRIA